MSIASWGASWLKSWGISWGYSPNAGHAAPALRTFKRRPLIERRKMIAALMAARR